MPGSGRSSKRIAARGRLRNERRLRARNAEPPPSAGGELADEVRAHGRTRARGTAPPPSTGREPGAEGRPRGGGAGGVDDSPARVFGEYLVEERALDRFQLLRALQMQDNHPGVFLGECIAFLGYLPAAKVQEHLARFLYAPELPLERSNRHREDPPVPAEGRSDGGGGENPDLTRESDVVTSATVRGKR